MSARLRHEQVAQHVADLRTRATLTPVQSARLDAVLALLDDEGRFLLRPALEAGEFPEGDAKAQEAFQDFRRKVNDAAAKAGVDLVLELDARKTTPDRRHGWFTGGDLVDAGIATFSSEAGRTDVAHPVGPEVAEIGRSRRTRVYVSAVPGPDGDDARRRAALVGQLRDALTLDSERTWEVASPDDVALGADAEAARDRLCAQADVRVVLAEPAYFVGTSPERDRALGVGAPVVVFALRGLPEGAALGSLHHRDVHRRDRPWTELPNTAERRRFVQDLVDALHRALRPRRSATEGKPDEHLAAWSERVVRARRSGDSDVVIEADTAETRLQESRLDADSDGHGPALPAVNRLVAWATAAQGPRLCALLGDVGMGKTTTAKLFTSRLLETRAATGAGPLPILFDLRDVRVPELIESLTLDRLLDDMLDANRPFEVPRETLNATIVRRRLHHGDAVVVFDGLDEVLVHLTPHDQRVFTRQLWRAVAEESSTRMLLTCRTQYFRTLRDEVSFFTGQDRQGLRGDDYLALLMLPFRPEQVREYLVANVGREGDWVDGFLETIGAVHDLPDLARRPVTLRLIADQVEFIESAKLAGRTLRSVDLYAEVVDRWLARDDAKHTLLPEHKQLLMEEIAAELWRSGRNAWTPAEVEDWLLALLERRPDLQRHYRERMPDLWKADFRTATFLSREGDTFAFGHRSLFEYFLARYLARTLADVGTGGDVGALRMPVPNEETLEFLGQLLAGAPAGDRSLDGLARIARENPPGSELGLAYALRAEYRGYPRQPVAGLVLRGADLAGWDFVSAGATPLDMTGADLREARMRGARLDGVDLTGADLRGADLSLAEIHGCRLPGARFDGADLTGTVLRQCTLNGSVLAGATLHGTEALWCEPPPSPVPGLRVAPLLERPDPAEGRLRVLTGHLGAVHAVAWSSDGSRLLTGGDDNTAHVRDAVTGRPLRRLAGHAGEVRAVAWSPDGSRLLTGSDDGTARLWDAATGEPGHRLDHGGPVRAVAWSPDGSRLLTGSDDGAARLWDAATGEPGHRLDHGGPVRAVAWSPDGPRIITGGRGTSARIWDAATGALRHEVADHGGGITTVAWSPDGSRVLTGSEDGTAGVQDSVTGAHFMRLLHLSPVMAVAWSPDGSYLLTGGVDDVARIWDAATGALRHELHGHSLRVDAVAWSPEGSYVLTGGGNGAAFVWDVADGTPRLDLTNHSTGVHTVAWSPDGAQLLTGARDAAHIWEAVTAAPHLRLDHTGRVNTAAWSSDGTRVLTGVDNATVRIWDAVAGTLVRRLDHDGTATALAWSPDGSQVLTGADDGTFCIRDAATGAVHHQLDHFEVVEAAAWSPDGTSVLTGAFGRVACIWDVADGTVRHRLDHELGWVNAVAWSCDGTQVLTGADDGAVRLWDPVTGTLLRQLVHSGVVTAVAWSSDGSRLLTGARDNVARVWDATTGALLHQLVGHADWITAVASSPDGTRVLTGSYDCTARLWDAETGAPTGRTMVTLPDGELAVFDAVTEELVGASEGAWRWLGWTVVRDGKMDRLPAETFGALPPLPEP